MNIHGKVVVITGASTGIGQALVVKMLAKGALVIASAKPDNDWMHFITHTANRYPENNLACLPLDLRDSNKVEQLINFAIERYDRIDILVNNAGYGLYGPIATVSLTDFESMLQVNLIAPLALTQFAIKHMRKDKGMIINISSVVGLRPLPYTGCYAASKAALSALTRALQLESIGLHVMIVYPGVTRTNFRKNIVGSENVPIATDASERIAVPAEKVAEQILIAIERNKKQVYISVKDRMWVQLNNLLGRPIDWGIRAYIDHCKGTG